MTLYAHLSDQLDITPDLTLPAVMRRLAHVSLPAAPSDEDLLPFGIYRQRVQAPTLLPYQTLERQGMGVVGSEMVITCVAVDLPLADAKADALARTKALRKSHETAGTMFMGMQIATGVEDIAKVAGAESGLAKKPAGTTVSFKTDSGFVALDLAAVQAVGVTIYDHIQACFAREAQLVAAIESAPDLAALRAVALDDGWP